VGISTATVLFTDLVGSTQQRAELGDDRADSLRREHDALLAAAVAQHGGTMVKVLGDGGMATFSSASDGVAAAVAIQQAIEQRNRTAPDARMSVRVGLSTGDVAFEGEDCFGVPVVEASRLCAAADGGGILVADLVRLLARQRGGFTFETAGVVALKGLPEPLAVSAVTWEPLCAEEAAALHMPPLLESGVRLRFAGRGDQLGDLSTAWKRALAGDRQAVLLAGEPGIGKTRLAREIAQQAHQEGAIVLYGRCEEDLGAPYQPFAEALDFFVLGTRAAELPARLGRYPGELVRLSPVLAALVPGLDPPLHSDAETERYRLFEAVSSWLTAAAEPTGLVLVLDDLHWATRPTLVLLQHLLHTTGEARMLVAGTYRDTDLGRAHPLAGLLADLRRSSGVSRVALSGLDVSGVTALLTDAAGHELDPDGAELARALQEETEGNPFFVGEILRHLRESGTIVEQDGRWVSKVAVSEVGIPEGIREVVGRRLDRLSPTTNTVLATASVVGRDFELELVSAVSEVEEDKALGALEEAVRARLIEETGVGSYRFAHALVRSTLYDELRATRRARTHARVGLFLERVRPAETVALAHHFVQSGDIDRAVTYSRRAGDEAMSQLAHDRAVDDYRQALELFGDVGPWQGLRCELLVALGEAQRRSGDAAYRQTLLDAAALAQDLGAVPELILAALANTRGFWSMAGDVDAERIAVIEAALTAIGEQDSADRARLLAMLATELMFSAEDERRHALSDQATEVARRLGDVSALTDVLTWSVPANYVPWRMDVLLRNSDELMGLAASLDDPQRWAHANLWNFLAHAVTGDIQTADARLAVARRTADELGQPTLRWLITSWTTFRLLLNGDLDEAERQLAASFELGQRTGQPDAFTWYAGQLWVVLRERGELTSLIDTVRAEVESNPGLPAWETVLALMCCLLGEHDEAARILDKRVADGTLAVARDVMWLSSAGLIEIAEAVGNREAAAILYDGLLPFRHLPVHGGVTYLGSTERYLGAGARTAGDLDTAVEHLERAIAFEERMGARTWLGVACADLGQTLRRRGAPGDADRAEELIARAQSLAVETGSVAVERRAAGQLA